LGTIAGARSGDKGGSANVGLWVREERAYGWLASMVTEREMRTLLPEAADLPIHITRLPNLLAVNVVIEGLLGEGVAYNARFDPQAKGLGEWLRSRLVDIPEALLRDAADSPHERSAEARERSAEARERSAEARERSPAERERSPAEPGHGPEEGRA
jgi:hypothetical protein